MNRRTTVQILVAVLLITSILGCAGPRQGAPSIDGRWTVASALLGGQEVPVAAFAGSVLELAAGRYEFQGDSGVYSVVKGSKPHAIDIVGSVGPNAGRSIPAIFELAGDALTICYDLSGDLRPAAFESKTGTQQFHARYVRAQ